MRTKWQILHDIHRLKPYKDFPEVREELALLQMEYNRLVTQKCETSEEQP